MRYLFLILLLLIPAALHAQDEIECPEPPSTAIPAAAWHIGQGDAHAVRAQHSLALIDYTCAIDLAPDDASAYARRAYTYAALANDEAAMADYEQALALDETRIEIYINRGALYAQLGNFGLAIGDFTLALSLNPQAVTALNNRAVVHAIEGNFDLALADLEQAISINPDDPTAYATRGAVYSALAAQDYQQFLTVSGGDLARLPAGTPGQVLAAVDDGLRTGNYAVWLALLRRGQ
jgi:tetratricopeptide (TPR) repeat protein